jgi:DNA-binding LacI/PurR family transcriptional regulator
VLALREIKLSAKRVTSQDVATRAGVSRTTVSLVLNDVQGIQIKDETRRRVIEAAEQLGYVPEASAQALASRRVKIIGLLLTRSTHHIASDTFLTQILDGLIEVVHERGLRLLIDIIKAQHQKEAYLQLVRSKRIDGVILSGPRIDDEALKLLEQEGFPTVIMGQLPGMDGCSVDVDNCAAAQQAVTHLINLGHRRIACITNAALFYTAAEERLQGYRRALEAAGIAYDPELVRYGDFDPDSGYHQMADLLDRWPPGRNSFTAAFVASDVVAFGAKAAIRDKGLNVPGDIALVGFDDVPISRYTDPPLTTVRLPARELGRVAGDHLVRMINGEKLQGTRVLLDTQLLIRESCGAKRR